MGVRAMETMTIGSAMMGSWEGREGGTDQAVGAASGT
jgi:hypothetical protein